MNVLVGFFILCAIGGVSTKVYLEPYSSIFLPHTYDPAPEFKFPETSVEQNTFDATDKIIYTVGKFNIKADIILTVVNVFMSFK